MVSVVWRQMVVVCPMLSVFGNVVSVMIVVVPCCWLWLLMTAP